jgi:hypothetical protein
MIYRASGVPWRAFGTMHSFPSSGILTILSLAISLRVLTIPDGFLEASGYKKKMLRSS